MLIKHSHRKGFTIVEVAVVAPLMIVVVVALIGLLVALVNGIAVPTKQNSLVNDGKNVFEAASSDIKNSSSFLASLPSGFSDPNSSSYASPPPNTEVLRIQGYNQTADPTDTTGTKVLPAFKGTAPCNSTAFEVSNVVAIAEIYFVKDGTLWRRVLTDPTPGSTCNTPLLIQQTCPPGSSCDNEDTAIAKGNVTEFSVVYYVNTTDTTVASDKTTAKSVLMTIKGSTPNASGVATYTSSLRISRISD